MASILVDTRKDNTTALTPPYRPQIRSNLSTHAISSENSTEIEAKYFIPLKLAQEITRGRTPLTIEQHYFSSKQVAQICERFRLQDIVQDSSDFTSCRIRRTNFPTGSTAFQIEFKGRKRYIDGALIARREFSVDIPEKVYEKLKKVSGSGTMCKRRYEVSAIVPGRDTRVVAQIDIIERAGLPAKKLSTSLATVDIELTDPSLMEVIRKGVPQLSFLKRCYEMSMSDPLTEILLSSRRLAKSGITDEHRAAIKRLERELR